MGGEGTINWLGRCMARTADGLTESGRSKPRPYGCFSRLGDAGEDFGGPYIGGRSKRRPYEKARLAAEEFSGDTVRDEYAER